MDSIELHSGRGRKYLTQAERQAFYAAASELAPNEASFCLVLLFTGCRISEALNLISKRLDHSDGTIIFETLKRRRSGVFRGVPVPRELLAQIPPGEPHDRIWAMPRITGYRIIRKAMTRAGIQGSHASPKGLRHGFGVACAEQNVPLNAISYWMGHASSKTTEIYLTVVGEEERRLAKRLWSQFDLAKMSNHPSLHQDTE